MAILPGCAGEKRWHGGASGLSRQKAGKKITPGTEERHQLPLVRGPRIITGAALQRRWRDVAVASHARKEDVDLSAVYLQPSPQVARPLMLMRYPEGLPRTPLAGIIQIKRKLSWLQHHQILFVLKKIKDWSILLPHRSFMDRERWRT